jgi:CobQ/CobB/MinD/ParA nucleotide binding domain
MDAMTTPVRRGDVYEALAAPVVILVGHFGSGKSEIALNLSLGFRARGEKVSVVDLDVVKPYFRCRQAREELEANGIRLVAPEGENAHADLPIILPAVRHLLEHGDGKVLMDVGGDPVGARALGSVSDAVVMGRTEHLVVLNFFRPYTETVAEAVEMVRAIEAAARLPVTGLVSNNHLMSETTPEIVLDGLEMAEETAGRLCLPIVAAVADETTASGLAGCGLPCPLLVLKRVIRPPFEGSRQLRKVGPLFVLN